MWHTPPPGPNSFIFIKIISIWELAHPLWKILDPPLWSCTIMPPLSASSFQNPQVLRLWLWVVVKGHVNHGNFVNITKSPKSPIFCLLKTKDSCFTIFEKNL